MALDRQRILTELGSVVNQLQSADCGCMGKLFNNPGQNRQIPMGSPLSTCGACRRGCCHGHGYGGWNSAGPCGDPYTMNNHQGMQRGDTYAMNNQQGMQHSNPYTMNKQQGMHGLCMGRCNPPKLYADTYNYLTENLMQPTIKEVYNDLSSITPVNTVMNSPVANQMLGSKDAFAANNNSGGDSQYIGVPTNNMTNISNNMDSMPNNVSPGNAMGHMSGMGPQIMNMLGSNQVSKPNTIRSDADQGGNRLTGPMVIDAPQSPHGAVGVTQLSAPMRNKEGVYPNNNVVGYQNSNQYNNRLGPNISNTIPSNQHVQGSRNTSNMETNPAALQMDSSHHHRHGLHQQSIAKFNEMFPGVMKGMGGNLNFDPMAMAIQMNPANHHQTAMDTMQKMMTNNNVGINKTGHTNATPERPGTEITNNSNITHNQPNLPQVQNVNSEQLKNPNIIPSPSSNQYGTPSENNQQIYTAVTQQPKSQYQMGQQNLQPHQYNQQQLTVDPNSGNGIPPPRLPTLYERALGNQNELSQVTNPNVGSEEPENQQMIKEPIFPADTTKSYIPQQKYNTLGQPIEMLPAQVYHTREPALPQTVSPQPQQTYPNNAAKFSNVKSTISKTSLMGTKAIDRTRSRSQLQHIYNQYKGSQSFTQHNVRAPDNGVSYSEGKLNIPRTNIPAVQQNIPIERIGGDVLANNQIQDQRTNKIEQVMGQKGDVPSFIKPSGGITNAQVTNKKTRNGLQDQVYTSYPTSAAWSFHGDGAPRYSTGYRDRYRV